MNIEDEARQEADKRWPHTGNGGDLDSSRSVRRLTFVQGAVWASEQADHVERISRNLAQTSTLTGQDALLLVKTAQKIAEVEQPDREPSADTGCPHEACEIDTAGNPTRCADCGDDLDSVPDSEPSDAEIRIALSEWYRGVFDAAWAERGNEARMRAVLNAARTYREEN